MKFKSNATIQSEVYEELRWDPRVNEGDIGVSVDDGIVTLGGYIPTYAEKCAAEEAAKKVAGVVAVVNNIEVKLNGDDKRDQDIAAAAVNALTWNVWVPKEKIKVVVNKGWITLSGTVGSEYQKQTAASMVRFLIGVKGVFNEISVKPELKAKDIKAEIKRALHRHAEDDANSINVAVNDDVVQLSGKVRSWKEKDDAEWAALGTAGVRKVKNDVTIAY
jgi:osmotically-inducible protein OsmY